MALAVRHLYCLHRTSLSPRYPEPRSAGGKKKQRGTNTRAIVVLLAIGHCQLPPCEREIVAAIYLCTPLFASRGNGSRTPPSRPLPPVDLAEEGNALGPKALELLGPSPAASSDARNAAGSPLCAPTRPGGWRSHMNLSFLAIMFVDACRGDDAGQRRNEALTPPC